MNQANRTEWFMGGITVTALPGDLGAAADQEAGVAGEFVCGLWDDLDD